MKDLRNKLIADYRRVRELSLYICDPLETEDYVIQSMAETSPPKWHLAHTTWFFETFLLARYKRNFKPFDRQFNYLFNSYYNALGTLFKRPKRGHISRPGLSIILNYRNTIDEDIFDLLKNAKSDRINEIAATLILGLNHEEQHQELLITDIKHAFGTNPTHPIFLKNKSQELSPNDQITRTHQLEWIGVSGGLYSIGADENGFSFDNERPQHRVFLNDFHMASRLITNGEYLEFIDSGAYSKPDLWLDLGFSAVQKKQQKAPLYWHKVDGEWWIFTLNGFEKINPLEPVCHVSFYEADAYARFKGARLPTEAEWEAAAQALPSFPHQKHNDLSTFLLRPLSSSSAEGVNQMFGDAWEWTSSAYLPYPGFTPLMGPEGEYNGKFMSNQMVLKGGSCATPAGHIRLSYRNFFPPQAQWQFSGIRLAKDIAPLRTRNVWK